MASISYLTPHVYTRADDRENVVFSMFCKKKLVNDCQF